MNKISISPRNIFILLLFLFLFTRLYNLTILPIFTDESIYLYWAKYISTFHTDWFMSLTDGKSPIFIWILAFVLKIFPSSLYLLAGRLVSVFAGGIAIIGIYKLSLILFRSRKISLLSVFFAIINPFMLFHDRMVLFDSFLTTALIWSVYYALKASISFKKKDAILWGVCLGLSLLIKSPALIFVVLTPICFFLSASQKLKNKKWTIISLPLLAIFISEAIYNLQRLSPNYKGMTVKNAQFQLPLEKLLSNPFILFGQNTKEIFNWIISYYTLPIFAIGCLGILFLLYRDFKRGVSLFMLWFIPLVVFAFIGKIIFPRYILFTTPYFLIALASITNLFFNHVRIKYVKEIVLIALLFLSLKFDFYILTNPIKAPFPITDYNQYVSSAYSGYGLDKIFGFLDKKLSQGPQIMLVTQGKFGLFPYAFKLKYWDDKRMMFYQAWLDKTLDVDVYPFQKSATVYIVLWQNNAIPKNFPFTEVLRTEKPGGKNPIILAIPK